MLPTPTTIAPLLRDPMTGLYNAPAFHELLLQLTRQSVRYQAPLTLMLVGVRDGAALRAEHGGDAIDQLLIGCAGVIARAIRDVDLASHSAHERFAIALPKTPVVAARTLAERMLRALHQECGRHPIANTIPLIDIGLADIRPSRRSLEQLIAAAEQALASAHQATPPIVIWSDEPALAAQEWHESKARMTALHGQIATLAEQTQQHYVDQLLPLTATNAAYRHECLPHAERVAALAEKLTQHLGWNAAGQRTVRRGAQLHDIGMAVFGERLLTQTTPLELPELELVRQHPIIGVQLLEPCALVREELATILHHHERFDGTGYPDRLAGSHIPVGARIVHLLESWDRMTTPQPYRDALTRTEALTELTHHAGTQFDPELTQAFVAMVG